MRSQDQLWCRRQSNDGDAVNLTDPRNIKLTLQYDGTDFAGYEIQPGKKTIRGELEKALYKLFKTKIKTVSTSRTDSGVHAICQVINFQLNRNIPTERIVAALNSTLPETIRIQKAEDVPADFYSRYAAKSKEYEYLIFNGRIVPPFLKGYVWQVKPKLDLKKMRQAAVILKGEHDFKSFCAAKSDDTDFVRTLSKISVRTRKIKIWEETPVISLSFEGDGYLYKMVRNLVGLLVEVGLGQKTMKDVRQILKAKDRREAGKCAPAQGLCLVKINY
ncbi:MAG: tRNA pseudouridine(38-40) synthase TruA [bacterium]